MYFLLTDLEKQYFLIMRKQKLLWKEGRKSDV